MITQAKAAIRRLLPKNHFARGVSVLVGGTAGSQVLLILASPLLTRLYGPDDFGLLAVYASLLAIIGVVSGLRYELAIPLPEDDVEAANVAALSLLLVFITAALTGVLVFLLSGPISAALGVPALGPYLWLLPIGVLVAGAYKVFNYWAVRTKRFTTIAGTKLRQAVATIAIQLAAFKFGGIALLFGQVTGQGVGTTALGLPAVKSAGFKKVSWRGISRAAGRYRRFPIFSTWEGLFNSASLQVIPIIIAAFFSSYATGQFSLAHRVLSLPTALVGSAVSQVFFSGASEAKRDGTISDLVLSLHTKLAYLALPPLMMLAIYGQNFFEYTFGSDWRVSGEIAQWMSVWVYFQFISSPLSTVFSVYEIQKEGMLWQGILFILRMVAIIVGVSIGDILSTIILVTLASSIYYILIAFRIASLAGNSLLSFARPTFIGFLVAVFCNSPIIAAIVFMDNVDSHHYISFVSSVFLVLFWIGYISRRGLKN